MARKKNEITIRSSAAEYLTYVAAVGDKPESVEVRYEDENIWLTQKMLATVYGVDVRTINYHIKKIYASANNKIIIYEKQLAQYYNHQYKLSLIVVLLHHV